MNHQTTQQRTNAGDPPSPPRATTLEYSEVCARPVSARITTIPRAAERGPFTAAALRDLKFKAHDRKNSRGEIIKGNGTGPAGVWIQIGAKVLIDLGALDRWIEAHRLGAPT